MNGLSETSLTDVSPETIQTFHDLALFWMQANYNACGKSPEELYAAYSQIYDRIVEADTQRQKPNGSVTVSSW
jgi:hypothetical protein